MRTWIAATAAAVLLVGCGTAAAKPVTARPRSQTVAASAVPLRARALALAWRLVDELSPPPGTRTVHLAKLPPPLNQPQAPLRPGWVRVTGTLEAPAEPQSVWEAMLARTPHPAPRSGRPRPRGVGRNDSSRPGTRPRRGRTWRHANPAVPWHGPDRGQCRGSLAAGPDRGRAPGPGQLPVRHDLRAALAVPRDDTHVYQPGGHRRADVHHQRRRARTPIRGVGDALCPGGHRLHPPVHAPDRRGTTRRPHARRLPALLRHHGQRQAAAVSLGQRQATHCGRHPAGHPLPARCLTHAARDPAAFRRCSSPASDPIRRLLALLPETVNSRHRQQPSHHFAGQTPPVEEPRPSGMRLPGGGPLTSASPGAGSRLPPTSIRPARSWSVCARSACSPKVQAARSSSCGLNCRAGGGRRRGR